MIRAHLHYSFAILWLLISFSWAILQSKQLDHIPVGHREDIIRSGVEGTENSEAHGSTFDEDDYEYDFDDMYDEYL